MSNRFVNLALVAAVVGVGAFALLRSDLPAEASVDARPTAPTAVAPAEHASDPALPEMPSEHVHGASTATLSAADLTPPDEPAAIAWKTPAGWKTAPNPSTLRLATYKLARVAPDTEDADVSVVRAGGTADANIERWRDQFEGSGKETRTVKTVRGLKVTVVEIHGTYLGGSGASETSRAGWALVGAIVETRGLPYFFKLTGPNATVRSARPAFDTLVESIEPARSE
jgi:hypothetical protein